MSGLARVDGQAKTLCNGHSFQTSYFDLQLKASFSTLLAQNELSSTTKTKQECCMFFLGLRHSFVCST